jgi:Xaa-Pro dipeptidase
MNSTPNPPQTDPDSPPTEGAEYEQRLDRIRAEMEEQGIDYLLLGSSTDLTYAIGFNTKLARRLTMLVIERGGTPRLVMPDFEVPNVASLPPLFEPLAWGDGVDPAPLVASLLRGSARSPRIGVGAQLQARFLLDLIGVGVQADWVNGDCVMEPVRLRKSPFEIDALRRAGGITDAVIDDLARMTLEGLTEEQLFRTIQQLSIDHGSEPLVTGLVAFGENGASPHHQTSTRVARPGDAVMADYSPTCSHYRGDITRTLHLGRPGDKFRRVYEIVDAANHAAFERVRPGVPAEEIDAAAREHITRAGFGEHFLHRTGHGIGLDIHEPPFIVCGNSAPLEAGMTFTIEPGIYLEGRFGARVEDLVLVTEDGGERLTRSSHGIRVLGE